MVMVKKRPGESPDSMIRKFSRQVMSEGIILEMKKREFHLKPSLAKKLKVQSQLIFTGKVSETKKLQLLDESELFILPSQWEAFGISIVEAMARGNAIISTKTEGGKFLVSKENGLLYDFGNLKKLETSIEKLINEKLRENIQKDNLKKAKEFTWNKIAKNLYKEYNKL